MSFIGIVANQKDFTILKNKILKNIGIKNVTVICINKRSISNIKNIKFEIIILYNDSQVIKENVESINRICKFTKYLIFNSDSIINLNKISCNNSKIITYGLNRKAMITISSVKDERVLVALQNNLQNLSGKTIEVGETNINLKENDKIKLYHVLVLYAIFLLYSENNGTNTGKICFF